MKINRKVLIIKQINFPWCEVKFQLDIEEKSRPHHNIHDFARGQMDFIAAVDVNFHR